MLIFDRWGEIIFETHDVNIGWDGTYSQRNKKVQDGVYTWKITYKNRQTDLRNVAMGHVTLIR
ncbi:MAG: gliding motility-associated C-terminal domain-containing protein, partial [Crocinitomicaceae bacterium]|nr:gliding motility-associated C-terminal domain-containing protein [Crocinitomicaceae bacterium]